MRCGRRRRIPCRNSRVRAAYDVLSDDDKRRKYDQFGIDGLKEGGGGGGFGGFGSPFDFFNFGFGGGHNHGALQS